MGTESRKRPRNINSQYDVLNISDDLYDVEMTGNESGIILLNEIFTEKDIPSFLRERYIKILRDNWLTTIEQLKQLNNRDWIRMGIPENIKNAIISKLYTDDDDEDEYGSSNISHELSYPVTQPNNNDDEDDINDNRSDLETFDDFSDF